MATQLGVYQHALRLLGERRVASLSEDREPRRVLDDAYADVVELCLGQGMWSFAMRLRTVTKTDKGNFDFASMFIRPDDVLHVYKVAKTRDFQPENLLVHDFADTGGFWYADVDTLYVLHTSDDADFGGDLARWPQAFTFYVAATLASECAHRLTSSIEIANYCEQMAQLRYANALSILQVDGTLGMLPKDAEAKNPARLAATHEPARFMGFAPRLPRGGGA